MIEIVQSNVKETFVQGNGIHCTATRWPSLSGLTIVVEKTSGDKIAMLDMTWEELNLLQVAINAASYE